MSFRTFALPILILVGLVAAVAFFSEHTVAAWGNTTIPCIQEDHEEEYTYQATVTLRVVSDDTLEMVPSNIGVTAGCTAEIHTHDASGIVHIESLQDRGYTLGDFFAVWGKPLSRDQYSVTVSVDGGLPPKNPNIDLVNGQTVVVTYTPISK